MQAAKAKFDESVQAAKELMQKILISNEVRFFFFFLFLSKLIKNE